MELNAHTSAILVRMVEQISETLPIRVRHHDLTTTNNGTHRSSPAGDFSAAHGASRADAFIPTSEQRRAARAIANGKIGTLHADVLEMLMRRELLMYDGQSLVLTHLGRALSALQTRAPAH